MGLNFCVLLSRYNWTQPAVQLDYQPFVVFFVDAFRATANLTSSFGALCLSDDFAQRNSISHARIFEQDYSRRCSVIVQRQPSFVLLVTLESLKTKTGCRRGNFFPYPRINH
jgi:hypothetical protein